MLNDLRHGIRVLLQAKGWTVVVVLSLAVGIGANAAIFTAANGLLLRKLPVRDPDSLVRLRWAGRNHMANDTSDYGISARANGEQVRATFSYPMYQHFRSANQTMVDLVTSAPAGVTVSIDGRAESASALRVSGNYYSLLGVTTRIGRTITPEDDRPSSEPVAMISDRYWHSRFAGNHDVVGKAISVNNVPVTIVGVVAPEFTGTHRPAGEPRDLSIPLTLEARIGSEPGRLDDATAWWVQVTGRRKPGVTLEQVKGNLEGVFQHQARAGMESYLASLTAELRSRSDNQGRTRVPRLLVESANRGTYDADERQTRGLAILGAVVALVLLLVCANVSNLLLARATGRQREISVRLSIGATRFRVVRQLLAESLLLAGMGGVLGVAIARWGQSLLPPPVGTSTPADWRVAAFTSAMTVLAGIAFGIAPALRATRLDVGTALKANSRSVVASNTLLSRGLLVVQVSISLVLLFGAGLFLRTLDNLRSVDLGFDPQNLVLVHVNAEGASSNVEQTLRYFQDGMNRLSTVPGVKAATVSAPTLMSGSRPTTQMYVQGRAYPRGRDSYSAERDDISRMIVAPNYFAAMGIPVVTGRGFTDRDHGSAPKVAMINEAAARKFFPNENPVGRRFGDAVDESDDVEIVGVLRNVRYNSLREQPPPTVYVPHLQFSPDDLAFSVRTAVDPTSLMRSIRTAISEANPNIPILTIETQVSHLERRSSQEKVFAQAYTLFGGIAMFIAAIGLFGLLSYGVARRTREIGIRMAMGAQREEVLALVLRESMVLVIVGIVIGVAGALAAGRLIESQLFGLEPTDATTMLSAIALMVAVSAVAGCLPARRATRVDPMVALRYE